MAVGERRSLALHGLAPYWHDARGRAPGLILGYAAAPEHAYAQTLAAFSGVLADLQARPRAGAS